VAKNKPPHPATERQEPDPDKLRDMLRRHHAMLMDIGGDYEKVPGKPRWQALKMAHEIAQTLRKIRNGVDDPMPRRATTRPYEPPD
jgi:hypothetical protein